MSSVSNPAERWKRLVEALRPELHGFMAITGEADTDCAFCAIAAGRAPATVVRRWDDVIAIVPLNPVVEDGHILVIPHAHVRDVGQDPAVSGRAITCAAQLAAELDAANIITSKGTAATQTVLHLHLHVVTRRIGDGLALPWSATA
jgi:histidine triad (HIT) family protein